MKQIGEIKINNYQMKKMKLMHISKAKKLVM